MNLFFAISGIDGHYRKGTIAELSRSYNISHTFIYNQAKILISKSPELFGSSMLKEETKLEALLSTIRFYLKGKMRQVYRKTKSSWHFLALKGRHIVAYGVAVRNMEQFNY